MLTRTRKKNQKEFIWGSGFQSLWDEQILKLQYEKLDFMRIVCWKITTLVDYFPLYSLFFLYILPNVLLLTQSRFEYSYKIGFNSRRKSVLYIVYLIYLIRYKS